MKTEIIYEDEDLLVIHKPPKLATQTSKPGQADVVSELKNYLAKKQKKAGDEKKAGKEPYLGIIHRLDQPVEGLLVFAKNPKAAKALSADLKKGNLDKYYLTVAFNQPLIQKGVLEDYMIKDPRYNKAKIVTAQTKDAKKAVLHYEIGVAIDDCVLYKVELETGRFHQIRAQMAHAGMPLLGDQKYADEITKEYTRKRGIKNIALCAYELKLIQPTTKEELSFCIKPKGDAFQMFFSGD